MLLATWTSGLESHFYSDQWSVGRMFSSQLGLVVASLGKTVCNNFLCLVNSDKQQILRSQYTRIWSIHPLLIQPTAYDIQNAWNGIFLISFNYKKNPVNTSSHRFIHPFSILHAYNLFFTMHKNRPIMNEDTLCCDRASYLIKQTVLEHNAMKAENRWLSQKDIPT